MSPKQWLALLGFYTTYLFFGASIFYHIEHGYEAERRIVQLQDRIDINGEFWTLVINDDHSRIQDMRENCAH